MKKYVVALTEPGDYEIELIIVEAESDFWACVKVLEDKEIELDSDILSSCKEELQSLIHEFDIGYNINAIEI